MTSALLTDRYELTMLDAAIGSGTPRSRVRVRAVRAPPARGPSLRRRGRHRAPARAASATSGSATPSSPGCATTNVVSEAAIDWLADYRFRGTIHGYREGELYFPGSPILVVDGTFAEAVILETLALSVLNYDSAVASAAARMVSAAEGRPLAEMGSRRTGERSAVAAARAAYIAGFGATSNLEAGRSVGHPDHGHRRALVHPAARQRGGGVPRAGRRARCRARRCSSTPTTSTEAVATRGAGRRHRSSAPCASTPATCRRSSPTCARSSTRSAPPAPASRSPTTSTSTRSPPSAARRSTPTASARRVVTGSGYPASGMVYKLVAHKDDAGDWVSVAKASAAKATVGGRKRPVRRLQRRTSPSRRRSTSKRPRPADAGRELLVALVADGEPRPEVPRCRRASRSHASTTPPRSRELAPDAMRLGRGDPAIPTVYA